MLYLSASHSFLIDCLARELSEKGASPLDESWILLPSRVNQQWLLASLAERMPQKALAGCRVASWREWLLFLAGKKGDFVPGDFELRCAITEALQDRSIELFQPLFDWVDAFQDKEKRLTQLSRILSCGLLEASVYGYEPLTEWQKELYHRIKEKWTFPYEVLQQTSIVSESSHVFCFCIDEMPEFAWNILLSDPTRISIYHFSPCQMFWEDLCSDRERQMLLRKSRVFASESLEELERYLKDTHPLLANWGRLGRKTLRILESVPLLEKEEIYPSISRNSLLHCLQDDLLSMNRGDEKENRTKESSLLIVGAGSSRLREVQILKEYLLQIISEKKDVQFSDIAVFAPDIKVYEPLIRFVFGEEIPVRISPVSALSFNKMVQGLLLFFEMSEGFWDADRFFELLENRSLQTKQGLKPEDLNQWRCWLEDAKIRGGWEEKKGNWKEGLDHLLFGLLYLMPKEKKEGIRGLDWSSADQLDQFMQLIELLRIQAKRLSEQKELSLGAWADLLFDVAQELFSLEEDALFVPFLQKLKEAEGHFPDKTFSFLMVRSFFQDLAENSSSSFQSHLWQAVQFSSLQPGAIRPAKALFLIGMDSEHFPRKSRRTSFDAREKSPDKADVDRYLLLQAIFAAQEKLVISYLHIGKEDGKPVDVALPVQELLQTLDAFYRLDDSLPSEVLFCKHPSFEWDARYFLEKAPYPSYSEPAYQAALRKHCSQPDSFWPEIAIKEVAQQVSLSDLQLCASNPWRFFLRRTLGIYLREETLFADLRMRDFELPPYLKKEWFAQSLKSSMQEVIERQKHKLPPGRFGSYQKEILLREDKRRRKVLAKWGLDPHEIRSVSFCAHRKEEAQKAGHRQEPPLSMLLNDHQKIEITGTIEGLVHDGLLIDSSDSSFLMAVRNWPSLLLFLHYTGKNEVCLYNLRHGSRKNYVIDPQTAWGRWIDYFHRSQESFSPLIAPWAESFLRKSFDDWKKDADKTLATDLLDRSIRWVLEKNTNLNYEEIWQKWRDPLQTTFQEIVSC